MRIAVSGPMFAGKTALADYLRDEHGWDKIAYSDSLKVKLAKGMSGILERPVAVDEIVRDKNKYRRLLQDLGSFLGYDQGEGVQEQVDAWLATKRPGMYENDVIFDCVRWESQFDVLYENGFVLIELEIGGATQQTRAYAKGIDAKELDAMRDHEAEQGVVAEMRLDGGLRTEELANTLLRLAGVRRTKPDKIYVGSNASGFFGLN